MHKRKHPKVWGAGESGVARQPETEVMQGCQVMRKQSAVVCVVCVGEGRGGLGVSVCWLCSVLEKADLQY